VCACEPFSPCVVECEGKDACKNAQIECPVASECIVNCGADDACTKAKVTGPRDAEFSIYCDGTASCTDIAVLSAEAGDVHYSCGGKDACKGSGSRINCGFGLCTLMFTGESSGDSAQINVNGARGLQCVGRYAPCPDNFEPLCSEADRLACKAPHTWNDVDCACECPAYSVAACGYYEVFNAATCECEQQCPPWSPDEALCASLGWAWRDCECASRYCCLARQQQWSGTCWAETSEAGCAAALGQRCVWDTTSCLQNPPVNSLDPITPCAFKDAECTADAQCCSEICKADGLCL